MKFRSLAVALEKCAAPAIAIAVFITGVITHNRNALDEKRSLLKRRSLVAFRIVKRRDQHGRFVKTAPLREELSAINARLHGVAA